ncbi:MAG: hypothetical protein LBJ11_06650 [Oscillospiraceae bacterium]|jgi:hypothetical protein|nr:hypothetical protein [Oscillospiraceae bacterium]
MSTYKISGGTFQDNQFGDKYGGAEPLGNLDWEKLSAELAGLREKLNDLGALPAEREELRDFAAEAELAVRERSQKKLTAALFSVGKFALRILEGFGLNLLANVATQALQH